METTLIKKIIEIKSISGDKVNCLNALNIIKDEVKSHNIPCFVKKHNGFPFLIAGNLKHGSILLLSHVDIVPAKDEQFELKQKGNKIFGRGVLDMKGPLLASLDSFFELWRKGDNRCIFVITSDEEIGGFNGAKFLSEALFKNIKLAIVPDSTGNDLVTIQKAPFHIRVFSKGKSAHGSNPWKGINAAENLLKCCSQIIKFINGKTHQSTTATLTKFHSGETTNMIPDKAEAIIDIRIKQQSEVISLIAKIETITKNFQCNWKKIDEPLFFEIKKNSFFVKKWKVAFKKITKKNLKTKIEFGASDARFLWQKLNIPTIITSATGGGAHSNKEWVNINSLNQLSAIIIEFISSIRKLD